MTHLNDPGFWEERRGARELGERWESTLRGCWAVLILVLTAIDALVTATLGIHPRPPVLSHLGHVIADEYRAGANEWIDADVVRSDAEGVEL